MTSVSVTAAFSQSLQVIVLEERLKNFERSFASMFRSSLSLSCCLILSLASLYGVYGQECSTEAPDTTASSLSDTVHQVMTESAEDVRVAALCHVACINYVLNPGVANSTNGSMMNNGSSGEGPAVMPVRSVAYITQCSLQDLVCLFFVYRVCTPFPAVAH